ncbi:MAG: hypothetical protein BWY83_00216 [bacterium ADurb.Bin478]|nr:MAG: hypothetical protein BWY83_00216 [bacterium ADurb.Bin478]
MTGFILNPPGDRGAGVQNEINIGRLFSCVHGDLFRRLQGIGVLVELADQIVHAADQVSQIVVGKNIIVALRQTGEFIVAQQSQGQSGKRGVCRIEGKGQAGEYKLPLAADESGNRAGRSGLPRLVQGDIDAADLITVGVDVDHCGRGEINLVGIPGPSVLFHLSHDLERAQQRNMRFKQAVDRIDLHVQAGVAAERIHQLQLCERRINRSHSVFGEQPAGQHSALLQIEMDVLNTLTFLDLDGFCTAPSFFAAERRLNVIIELVHIFIAHRHHIIASGRQTADVIRPVDKRGLTPTGIVAVAVKGEHEHLIDDRLSGDRHSAADGAAAGGKSHTLPIEQNLPHLRRFSAGRAQRTQVADKQRRENFRTDHAGHALLQLERGCMIAQAAQQTFFPNRGHSRQPSA